MSVSGMKKQLHKANQLLNERLMGAKGTKLEEDFLKMERSVAVIHALLTELLPRTTAFLQPNPADRARLSVLNTVSRLRGRARRVGYPQTEGLLGDCMLQYGQELGAASEFGGALSGAGEALHLVAQARDALLVDVKCTFIDPLQGLHDSQLKEIRDQLKKVNSRRLDFDYKRRRSGKVPAGELQQAWGKFVTSRELAEGSMLALLQNDVDQLRILASLVTALLDFHRNAHRILLGLHGNLQTRLTAASNEPQRRFRPAKMRLGSEASGRRAGLLPLLSVAPTGSSGERSAAPAPRPSAPASGPSQNSDTLVLDQPCCRAMYAFHPDQDGELDFSEGDLIVLTKQVDVNWYEGTLGGRSGLFPVCYVDVLVPLPLP